MERKGRVCGVHGGGLDGCEGVAVVLVQLEREEKGKREEDGDLGLRKLIFSLSLSHRSG